MKGGRALFESMIKSDAAFFAILSDVHGNIDALDAVYADMREFSVRGIFCLGAIVGYGPEPAACVERVMENCAVSVLGNHEAMLFLIEQFAEDLDKSVGDPLKLAREQISPEQMKWLKHLPITADISPLTLCHASLNEPPSFHYIHGSEEAAANLAAQLTFVSFYGHTHVPAIWEEKRGEVSCFNPIENPVTLDEASRYAINVGSVGQPRDRDTRAGYALYDYERRLLLHRRVEYDIAKAQRRFKKAKLPAANASRLGKGQ